MTRLSFQYLIIYSKEKLPKSIIFAHTRWTLKNWQKLSNFVKVAIFHNLDALILGPASRKEQNKLKWVVRMTSWFLRNFSPYLTHTSWNVVFKTYFNRYFGNGIFSDTRVQRFFLFNLISKNYCLKIAHHN